MLDTLIFMLARRKNRKKRVIKNENMRTSSHTQKKNYMRCICKTFTVMKEEVEQGFLPRL